MKTHHSKHNKKPVVKLNIVKVKLKVKSALSFGVEYLPNNLVQFVPLLYINFWFLSGFDVLCIRARDEREICSGSMK